jgi:phosphoribosylformimino-5-aminoimidazole carboxamide ribotide isomerase
MLIIPAIDILDGKVVRLLKGDFDAATIYSNSPLDQAKIYESYNFRWVHIVDLSGSKDGKSSTKKIIKEIKQNTSLEIEFGGGIRSTEDVENLFSIGIDRAVLGSLPITNKREFELIVSKYEKDKFVIATDVLNENVLIKGWQENSNINLFDHITYCISLGLGTFLVTDVNLDGMLTGPNVKLYKKLKRKFKETKIIASGGISSIGDLNILKQLNIDAAVVGKAIYECKIKLEELSKIA